MLHWSLGCLMIPTSQLLAVTSHSRRCDTARDIILTLTNSRTDWDKGVAERARCNRQQSDCITKQTLAPVPPCLHSSSTSPAALGPCKQEHHGCEQGAGRGKVLVGAGLIPWHCSCRATQACAVQQVGHQDTSSTHHGEAAVHQLSLLVPGGRGTGAGRYTTGQNRVMSGMMGLPVEQCNSRLACKVATCCVTTIAYVMLDNWLI